MGTYIIVGRRKIGPAVTEMEEYLSRLKLIKVPSVIGFAFGKEEILEDKETFKEAQRVAEQILSLFNN